MLEEVLQRPLGIRALIDLAGPKPLEQFFRRKVDQFNFVGVLQHRVRDCLANDHASDRGHHVIEAFDVLDIERRPDVDAGVEKFLHILPAPGVPRTGEVRVGEFVDEQNLRPPGKGGVDVKLVDDDVLVSQFASLIRKVRSGGRDLITHLPGMHDDLAVATSGAAVLAGKKRMVLGAMG